MFNIQSINRIIFNKKLLYFSIFLFLLFTPTYPKIIKYINRSFMIYKVSKSQNCDFKLIKNIPNDSSVIIGHAYGSPSNHNDFIDQRLESFIIRNKSKINNYFFTGDVFSKPNQKKWEKLYSLINQDSKIFVAPGNHDFFSKESKIIFKKSINQPIRFPFDVEVQDYKFIIEDSTSSNWQIKEETVRYINNINLKFPTILLRHNIPVRELLPIANSNYGLKSKLPSIDNFNKLFKNQLIVISGDSGAFKFLPRFFCLKNGNIKIISNGIGGVKDDTILILSDKSIFKYKIN